MMVLTSTRTFQRIGTRRGTGRTATLLALLATAAGPAAADARPLATGLFDPAEPGFGEVDPPGAYAAARAAGATVVRVPFVWANVARQAPSDATDPADPKYDWSAYDGRITSLVRAGLEPLVTVYG